MIPRLLVRFVLALCVCGGLARAEKWQLLQGAAIDGEFRGLFGADVIFATKNDGSFQANIGQLDDDSLRRIAERLEALAPAPRWSDSESKIAKSLRKRLQILQGNKLVAFDPGSRPEPEFWLVYFSAHWCGPCRAFTPKLLESYHQLKAKWGDRFELVFISSDRDPGEQLRYIREVEMPWPVVKYSAVRSVALAEWAGRAIPCLVAVTRGNDVLYHSYRGSQYVGPTDVLMRFERLLERGEGADPNVQRARHRLSVIQHQRSAGGGDLAPQPYLIAFDSARYQTLEDEILPVTLELDAAGRVTRSTCRKSIGVILENQLTRDASEWLFLPAIGAGEPIAMSVELPLRMR